MEPRTLAALKNSIAHWERMATGKEELGETPYGKSCALCREFNDDNQSDSCFGCPIRMKTGEGDCAETPYWDFRKIYDDFGFTARSRQLARVQMEFLKSLLPKEE